MTITYHRHASTVEQRLAIHPAVPIVGLATLLYPFLLNRFHATVGIDNSISLSTMAIAVAGFWLAAAFACAACCLVCATRLASAPIRTTAQMKALRLSYIGVIAPTAYVFMGVLLYMAGSPLPDELVWFVAWLALVAWAVLPLKRDIISDRAPARSFGHLRAAHGVAAIIVLVYVAFHLTNHLFGLVSPQHHAAVMDIGRSIYRASFVEPILVAVMLFQIITGLVLAWKWGGQQIDGYRVFQVASGMYLSMFILGHMNSVFFFARTFLGIPTDWAFAIGAPNGLIHDPWNIRLVPHYWLGVFMVLSHLSSGMRIVLMAHDVNRKVVFGLWSVGLAAAAVVATLIILAMCGLRLSFFAS